MLQNNFSGASLEAGLDEAGRGCLAGPVVAAAVILPPDFQHEVLNDSKQLSKEARLTLEEDIKQKAVSWAVAEVSNEEIDEINILNASFLAMHRALDRLGKRPAFLLVDGNRFKPYQDIPFECMVKGDGRYFSIAAASVLAKTYRDRHMEQIGSDYPHYDWVSNVGYPTKRHRQAIREHGPSEHHRYSFQLLPAQYQLFEE